MGSARSQHRCWAIERSDREGSNSGDCYGRPFHLLQDGTEHISPFRRHHWQPPVYPLSTFSREPSSDRFLPDAVGAAASQPTDQRLGSLSGGGDTVARTAWARGNGHSCGAAPSQLCGGATILPESAV